MSTHSWAYQPSNPAYRSPIYAYPHDNDRCAITGGAFYTPATQQFPSDFRGKYVLMEFWATWCPICAELLPRMEAAQQKYGDRAQFVVVAVAVNQSKNSVRRHLEKHPMPFTFLWDGNGAAVRAFQAPSTSYIAVLDAKGKVVYTGVGEDQDIEAALSRAAETPKAAGKRQ